MINDYDSKAKERQNEILNKVNKAHTYVEKPMMKSMLKNIDLKKVLLLGCGTGDESRVLKELNAKEIVGIDISKESIDIAKNTYPNCKFYVSDMHKLPFNDNSFDFVYSSLAIHYSKNPEKVFEEVYRVLKNDGYFLFSVGHPLRWASEKVKINNEEFKLLGYQNSKEVNKLYG